MDVLQPCRAPDTASARNHIVGLHCQSIAELTENGSWHSRKADKYGKENLVKIVVLAPTSLIYIQACMSMSREQFLPGYSAFIRYHKG